MFEKVINEFRAGAAPERTGLVLVGELPGAVAFPQGEAAPARALDRLPRGSARRNRLAVGERPPRKIAPNRRQLLRRCLKKLQEQLRWEVDRKSVREGKRGGVGRGQSL